MKLYKVESKWHSSIDYFVAKNLQDLTTILYKGYKKDYIEGIQDIKLINNDVQGKIKKEEIE